MLERARTGQKSHRVHRLYHVGAESSRNRVGVHPALRNGMHLIPLGNIVIPSPILLVDENNRDRGLFYSLIRRYISVIKAGTTLVIRRYSAGNMPVPVPKPVRKLTRVRLIPA